MYQFSGRTFLEPSPSLNAISWVVERRNNPKYNVPKHFYGKFTIHWKGVTLGIHSYGEHGEHAHKEFLRKCSMVDGAIVDFIKCVADKRHVHRNIELNGDDTPFSGSIFMKVGATPSGVPICLFEFASCKAKIRLHAHELGSEKNLISVLNAIREEIGELYTFSHNWKQLEITHV